VVPGRKAESEFHVFVAVARDPADKESANVNLNRAITDAVIYEIEGDGEIRAMTRLPRVVVGWPHTVLPGALVWSCDRGSLIRLGHSVPDFSRGFTGAADDMLCRVEWYREIPMRTPNAWFWADPEYGVACSSNQQLFRSGVSYVRKPDEKVYRFKINVIDIETGLDSDLTLAIPFDGDFTMPETGKTSAPGWTHAHQPHLLRISGLQLEGDLLQVSMKQDGTESVCIEFHIQALLAASDGDGSN